MTMIPRRPSRAVAAAVASAAVLVASIAGSAGAAPPGPQDRHDDGKVRHVIEIQFDNVHFTRDNPNVPSDLEQMPHLLSFLTSQGVLLTNHHTPLIAHTATDILTTLTGVYGDRHGVPVSNSFRYFNPDGTSNTGVSFAYWTDPIFDPTTSTPTDTTFNMLTENGKNAPAPWVPFTRAGMDVGMVATANTVLENTATDIPTVFGVNSPQAAEVASNPAQAFADFVGIAVHCARQSTLCSTANGGQADRLPDEPGGYSGYNGLFGHKYVAPQISPSGPLTDLSGNVIQDPAGHVGFPGFDGMSAAVTLSYVAAMQEHGIPVTYAYISDAHDKHPSGPAYGPGEAGYVAALKSYDDAFATFFARLAKDGITPANTLFVVTADENDHFVGGAPSPAGCDGVTTPCTYSQIGEVNANLAGLLATEQGVTTPFKVHSDSAPNVYITGNPARDATVTRTFEQATSKLTALNPITGATDTIAQFQADPVEEQILHMVTADPARTPTFTMFANPDYFLFAGAPNCNSPCVAVQPGFAWNHGDVSPDINRTWLGIVGPGVRPAGTVDSIWSDHTDVRPTMLAITGLRDDYVHDGRVLWEILDQRIRPEAGDDGRGNSPLLRLAADYKQLDAGVGRFALATLAVSSEALASETAGDATYADLETWLQGIGSRRDALAHQIRSILDAAAFGGAHANGGAMISLAKQAEALIAEAEAKAS